jgi:hypothetical protein
MVTLRDCLYHTIHLNKKPLKLIAEEIGMSENYLTRAALPDAEESDTGTGCRFPLKKLIPLIKATGDLSVLDMIENNLGRVAIALPPPVKATTADICRLSMQSMKEFGKLVGDVEKSIADSKITCPENERIQAEAYKTIQSILNLVAACKSNGGKRC